MTRPTTTRACTFLRVVLSTVALSPVWLAGFASGAAAEADDWKERDVILKRIVAPTFPDRDFPITTYGAVGNGRDDAHPAIVQAVEACRAAGGGRVVIPAGVFLSNGPVHLRSSVNLHLAEGATLQFGTNPKDYLPVVLTRWIEPFFTTAHDHGGTGLGLPIVRALVSGHGGAVTLDDGGRGVRVRVELPLMGASPPSA